MSDWEQGQAEVNARWHDDDAFWEAFEQAIFTPERWRKAAEETDQVLALAGVAPGARVLDMACGPGRHAVELARRGYRVVGVDRTASYLAAASEACAEHGLAVELVEADMRGFVRPAAFELALSLFTAFGYFEDPDEDRLVAANLHASLAPGGVLVMELMGREVLTRIFVGHDWTDLGDGRFLLQERRLARDLTWIDNRWILIDQGRCYERRAGHRLYSGSELARLLSEVGFAEVSLFGGLDGSPYDLEAKRLVLVARK